MALTKIAVPPFKDPQLLNFAKQVQLLSLGGTSGGTQTGTGKPKVKTSDTTGATYWDSTANNFWIFKEGNWEQLDQGLRVDKDTGQVYQSDTGAFYGWYYKYLSVKFADNETGTSGFSDYPTNKNYYGYYNSDDGTEPTDPTKYLWSNKDLPSGGFGTNFYLFYETQGGRRYKEAIAQINGQPEGNYTTTPVAAIDLDVITTALGPVALEGEQYIAYSNSISGLVDFSRTSPVNRAFIGFLSKAGGADPSISTNYVWKALPAVPGPSDRVFASAGTMGSINLEVGTSASDETKYSDLTYQATPTNPSFNPNDRSGYVVSKVINQSGGSGVGAVGAGSPVAGAGDVVIGLPYVGSQGVYDLNVYRFMVLDAYGRVAKMSVDGADIDYSQVKRNFFQYTSSTTIALAHEINLVLVFKNGILLTSGTDYTEAAEVSGSSASITIPSWKAGENVTTYSFRKTTGSSPATESAAFTRTDAVISTLSNTYTLPSGVEPATEIVYINGVQLPDNEYTYAQVGSINQIVLAGTDNFPLGATLSLLAFSYFNSVLKFNQGNTNTVQGTSAYNFALAPRPAVFSGNPTTYQLAMTLSGVLIDETGIISGFTGDYTNQPAGNKTVTLTSPAFQTNNPLQYTTWVSDKTYA